MGSGWWGGQGGCERRIKVFVKIQKKIGGGGRGLGRGGGWGVRVDVNEELIFFVKIKEKKFFWGVGVWGGQVGGSGWWGGWVRVDVKAMLREGGDVGYGGCEPRVEGIVQGTKRYCTILRE